MIFSFSCCIFTHPFLQGQPGIVCFFTAKVLAKSKENCLCHLTEHKVMSHCDFDLHFPNISGAEHFCVFVSHLNIFFGKISPF